MAVAASSTDSTPGADAAGFVEQFADAWGRSDLDALMALLADDVVLEQPMLPRTVGKAAAREAFTRLFTAFPGLRATVHRWAGKDELLFIEFTLSCDFGGRELSWAAVDRFVLHEGLVAERINYFDPMHLFLGILRRPRGWRNLVALLKTSRRKRRPPEPTSSVLGRPRTFPVRGLPASSPVRSGVSPFPGGRPENDH